MSKKIKTIEEITSLIDKLKKSNKKIVTTNGTFDILHYAHVNLLKRAKNEGDILIVLLNSDDSVKRNKGLNRPIIPQKERAEMIESLECVNYVIIFNEDTALNILGKIKPDIQIKGGSFDSERMKDEKELIESNGGQYKCFDLEDGFSTTNIIQRIIETQK